MVSCRVYITDIDNWPTFNKMYSSMMGAHRPARAVVPVPCLHYGFLLEMEAIVALP
jgi:enamine deaminase RidA (YjgF/YER057c/UK114 family)